MNYYRNVFFFLALLLYTLFFIAYVGFTYDADKKELLKKVDKDLYANAIKIPYLLPHYFEHGSAISDMNKELTFEDSKNFKPFIALSDKDYVYTIINKEGTLYFTASSHAPKMWSYNGKFFFYFDTTNAEQRYHQALQKSKVSYGLKNHAWGAFLTSSVVWNDEKGRTFILGADIPSESLDESLSNIFYNLLYFIFPIVLVMFIYLLIGIYFHLRLEKIIIQRTTQILHINTTDPLTKLANRKALIEELDKDKNIHLALMNINAFSSVNDLYGSKVGDELLLGISRLITSTIALHEVKFYKLHGDEFAFISPKKIREYDFLLLMELICAQISDHEFVIKTHHIKATVCVGVSSMSTTALICANTALKEARHSSKPVYLYEAHLDKSDEFKSTQKVIALIHEVLKNEQVKPFFQPIYSVKEKKIVKYESLMRLIKHDDSVVLPGEFLQIAHQAKLYDKLSTIMLDMVLEKAMIFPEKSFSFNLSAVDIEDKSRSEYIKRSLKQSGIAKRLTLEILETEGFSSYKVLAEFIAEVRSYGVKIAIDDFGSGYSNFSEVADLNVDYLKIDGSLVKDVLVNVDYEHIIEAIIKFGHSLKLEIIAEFVENEAIANKLETMGVDMLQGYYIGKPMEKCQE